MNQYKVSKDLEIIKKEIIECINAQKRELKKICEREGDKKILLF